MSYKYKLVLTETGKPGTRIVEGDIDGATPAVAAQAAADKLYADAANASVTSARIHLVINDEQHYDKTYKKPVK